MRRTPQLAGQAAVHPGDHHGPHQPPVHALTLPTDEQRVIDMPPDAGAVASRPRPTTTLHVHGTDACRPAAQPDPDPPVGPHVVSDLDFECELSTEGGSMAGHAVISDALRFDGSAIVRPSVLATIADCVTGLPACLATSPALAVTLDIVVRTVGAPSDDDLDITAVIIKPGRRTVSGEVAFRDPRTGALVAHSYLHVHGVTPPPGLRSAAGGWYALRWVHARLVPDHVGVRIIEPGVSEIDLTPFVAQASNTLQGGIVALLGETAAHSSSGRPVIDLDTRYLTAVRIGPGRATATPIGPDLVEVASTTWAWMIAWPLPSWPAWVWPRPTGVPAR